MPFYLESKDALNKLYSIFLFYRKMSALNQQNVHDKLVIKMAILMLSKDERYSTFGNEKADAI